MANGHCPKCGAVKENPKRSYCKKCENEYQNARNAINPPKPRTPEQAERQKVREQERFANMTREQLVEYYKRKQAWRLANPFTEGERIGQRERAAKARSKWTPERLAQQKKYHADHYNKLQLRPALGLCAFSVSCNEVPLGSQKFCLVHWCRTLRQAEIRLKPEYTVSELIAKWQEQQGRCAISGVALIAGDTAALDHIVPIAKGGNSSITNLRFIHSALNRMKWDLSDEAFRAAAREIIPGLTAWSQTP